MLQWEKIAEGTWRLRDEDGTTLYRYDGPCGLVVLQGSTTVKDAPVLSLVPEVAGEPRTPRKEKNPLPFTVEVALAAIEGSSAGRFVAGGKEHRTKGVAIAIAQAVRAFPDIEMWRAAGELLAGGYMPAVDVLGPSWVASGSFRSAMAVAGQKRAQADGTLPAPTDEARQALALLATAARSSGGFYEAPEERHLTAAQRSVLTSIAIDFHETETWHLLGLWMASGGISWMRQKPCPTRMFLLKAREWFELAKTWDANRKRGSRVNGKNAPNMLGGASVVGEFAYEEEQEKRAAGWDPKIEAGLVEAGDYWDFEVATARQSALNTIAEKYAEKRRRKTAAPAGLFDLPRVVAPHIDITDEDVPY